MCQSNMTEDIRDTYHVTIVLISDDDYLIAIR